MILFFFFMEEKEFNVTQRSGFLLLNPLNLRANYELNLIFIGTTLAKVFVIMNLLKLVC